MKNYSRSYTISQEGINSRVVVALDGAGKPTFIAKETRAVAKTKLRKTPKPWSKGKYQSVCNFRLAGMGRLIGGRHRGPVDTDDAETYYLAALPHLVARNWAYGRTEDQVKSVMWALTWTPDLVVEKGREWFAEQEQRILCEFDARDGRPSIPDADEFADMLRITSAEVVKHRLLTVGAVDRREAQRIEEEQAADREYQQQRRDRQGATRRKDSMSARKPWEAYDCSRSTYKRKVASGEIQPDPVTIKRKAKAAAKARPVLRLISQA